METSPKSEEPSLNPSISSAGGSRVKTSAKLESASASRDLAAAFGLSSPVLLGSFDPDTFLLRTSQASLFQEQCPEWSESWPDSGMWDAGAVYELQSSVPVTCESECSSSQWRTPDAPGSGGPRNRQDSIGNGHQVTIAEQAEPWQTPATDSFRSRGGDRKDEMGLDQQARFWPTTSTSDKNGIRKSYEQDRGQGGLNTAAHHFPTPASRDYRTPNAKAYSDRGGGAKGEQLQNFVAHSLPDPLTPDGPQSSKAGPTSPRRLNPQFVEWLMGFPIGWSKP